jgi:hypothetical protein
MSQCGKINEKHVIEVAIDTLPSRNVRWVKRGKIT